MIAIDTNVLLRYIVQDDPAQAVVAAEVMEARLSPATPGFVGLVVLAELWCSLVNSYDVPKGRVRGIIVQLMATRDIRVEAPDVVRAALADEATDFADALVHHSGRAAGCAETVTFDRRFARQEGVRLAG
ncbi:PIN domain-containing protein [Sandaracinobacteroides saxicola]|uniref:Type II toxin-antitoxin system VapC family toxin n=1 Tax=Sandaracinobacteroides saxicola TaxID=2759707 RepID=A0A7G5IJ93_9SPHN|nr:type II toxin-antitoxin system VapC family toxin [Sandaracinobacteroides saxicola]QMW23435.1 type II toxin-antitoxin system VapC family toxin [Sandaracinobacteroides saxicola]